MEHRPSASLTVDDLQSTLQCNLSGFSFMQRAALFALIEKLQSTSDVRRDVVLGRTLDERGPQVERSVLLTEVLPSERVGHQRTETLPLMPVRIARARP